MVQWAATNPLESFCSNRFLFGLFQWFLNIFTEVGHPTVYNTSRPYICESIIRLLISNCNLTGETSGKNIYLPYRKLVISLTRCEIVSVWITVYISGYFSHHNSRPIKNMSDFHTHALVNSALTIGSKYSNQLRQPRAPWLTGAESVWIIPSESLKKFLL